MKSFKCGVLAVFLFVSGVQFAQESLELKGLAIAAPSKPDVDLFVKFIQTELVPRQVNTLVLRIDYNYQYTSYPQLAEENALSLADVKKIVGVCKEGKIEIIPQINLLGHQSWAESTGKLLQVFPEFDETPHVKIPEKYEWPNEDGLYCKSYCPLHPEVHKVVFALVDEITAAFEAKAFHAGMDEVFYIGDDKCPRCSGMDKAALYAGEVTKIRNHLALSNKKLWIWGDRLIDGKLSDMGMWEASMNNTHRAISMIPKDVMICDWHYERPDPTAVYFAMNGFDVATCAWRKPEVAREQQQLLLELKEGATTMMKSRYKGMMHTVWSGAGNFLKAYYAEEQSQEGEVATFKTLFPVIF